MTSEEKLKKAALLCTLDLINGFTETYNMLISHKIGIVYLKIITELINLYSSQQNSYIDMF